MEGSPVHVLEVSNCKKTTGIPEAECLLEDTNVHDVKKVDRPTDSVVYLFGSFQAK